MSRHVARSIVHTKRASGPDVSSYLWMLIVGLGLLGSSLFVLFMGH